MKQEDRSRQDIIATYDVKEVAKILHCSIDKVRSLINNTQNGLSAIVSGNKYLILKDDLLEFLHRNKGVK